MSRHYSDHALPTAITARQNMDMYGHSLLCLDDYHRSLQCHNLQGIYKDQSYEVSVFDSVQEDDLCLDLAFVEGIPGLCLAGQATVEEGDTRHISLEVDTATVAEAVVAKKASVMPEEHEPARMAELANETIQRLLQAKVTPGNCGLIRMIFEKISALVEEGTACLHVSHDESLNCIWGFNVLEVRDPVRFNQAFRAIAPKGRGDREIKRPTEVFMKIMRFCGVTARRGARGPAETDPDRRDFMYSYFYDFDSDKQEYMRRKLCLQGYCPEMRKAAEKRKGAFIDEAFSKRAKRG